uniref:Fimbrial assembly family protein n=1 Tax=Thermodesulfobacterium geofontis TaxID=1295609 RepID=A0A7V5XFW1_9BACT
MGHTWIIKPLKEDLFEGFKFDKKFKNFEFFSKIKPSQLKNQRVYLILEPQLFFIEILEVPGKIKEFIRLQVENRVKESGIFLSPPKTIYKILETLEVSSKVFVFSIEEKNINFYLEKLREVQVRVELITHKLLSTFCWFKKTFSHKDISFPILLIILDPTEIWYLVVSEKAPLYGKFLTVDEFIGISSQALLGDILTLRDYLYRFFREDLKGILLLGKEREKIGKEELIEATKLPLINLDLSLAQEAYTYPEIFGAIELETEFNFLPYSEKAFLDQIKRIEKLTPLFLGLVALNLFLGITFYKMNLNLEKKIELEILSMKKSINEISNKLPETSLQKIKTYVNLEKENRASLKLNEFLIWLSQNWDNNLVLKNLKIENVGNNTFKISIDIEIRGDFLSTQKKIDELIKNFGRYFKIESSNFSFLGKENRATLSLSLIR